MANISRYEQNKLVSAQTNVLPADQSNLQVANTLSQSAGQLASMQNQVTAQHVQRQAAIGTELVNQFVTGLRIRQYYKNAADKEKQTMIDNDEAAQRALAGELDLGAMATKTKEAFAKNPDGAEKEFTRNALQYVNGAVKDVRPEVASAVRRHLLAKISGAATEFRNYAEDQNTSNLKARELDLGNSLVTSAGSSTDPNSLTTSLAGIETLTKNSHGTPLENAIKRREYSRAAVFAFVRNAINTSPALGKGILENFEKEPNGVFAQHLPTQDRDALKVDLDSAFKAEAAAAKSAREAESHKITLAASDIDIDVVRYKPESIAVPLSKLRDMYALEKAKPAEQRDSEVTNFLATKIHSLETLQYTADSDRKKVEELSRRNKSDAKRLEEDLRTKAHRAAVAKANSKPASDMVSDVLARKNLLASKMSGPTPTATAQDAQNLLLANEVANANGYYYSSPATYKVVSAYAKAKFQELSTKGDPAKPPGMVLVDAATQHLNRIIGGAPADVVKANPKAPAAANNELFWSEVGKAGQQFQADNGRPPSTDADFVKIERAAIREATKVAAAKAALAAKPAAKATAVAKPANSESGSSKDSLVPPPPPDKQILPQPNMGVLDKLSALSPKQLDKLIQLAGE